MSMLVGCAAPEGAGCYTFDWSGFTEQEMVPIWVVPDGVTLVAERRDDGSGYLVRPNNPTDDVGGAGNERGWDGVLFDRSWTRDGDTLRIVLQDIGYHRWDLALDATSSWTGTATFSTTVGGGERQYEGLLSAAVCPVTN